MKTNLTLKQMAALAAIADHGNFSAAADFLHVSQPALSRTVRLAEEALGTRIFDRDTRSVRLTPAGEEFLPIARRVLGEFEDSMGELAQFIEGKRGRVRVSAVPSIAQAFLLRAVQRFTRDYPGVGFMLRVDSADQLLDLLERREIDVGLSVQPPPDGRFSYRHLLDDHFVLVCPQDDPLAQAADQPVAWSTFASRPFVAVMNGSNTRAATDAAFVRAGLNIRPAHEVASNNLPLIGSMIAAGLGVSALPRSALSCLGQPSLVGRPLQKPVMSRRIGILHLADRSQSASVREFCQYLEDVINE